MAVPWPEMGEAEAKRRAEISRRLKAARWLAGTVAPDEKKPGRYKPKPIEPADLAQRPPLPENRITANMIGETERLDRDARPMELEKIALALGLAKDFFEGPSLSSLGEDVGPRAGELRRELQGEQPNQADRPNEGAHPGEGHRSGGDA